MGPFDNLTAAQRQQIRDARASAKEAAARLQTAPGRGTCRVCDRPDRKLNKDGTVRQHSPEENRGSSFLSERVYRCPGSGQPPKEG